MSKSKTSSPIKLQARANLKTAQLIPNYDNISSLLEQMSLSSTVKNANNNTANPIQLSTKCLGDEADEFFEAPMDND